MCLERIEMFKTNGKGFQVVRKISKSKYKSWLKKPYGAYALRIPRKAYKVELRTALGCDSYTSGFHILTRKGDAVALLKAAKGLGGPDWEHLLRLVEVSYSQQTITATGWQYLGGIVTSDEPRRRLKTVVAGTSTILREVKV